MSVEVGQHLAFQPEHNSFLTAMSFDAFEARMQFLQLLKKLNASAQSIQKVVGFAVKYGARCGEDLWEVIMDECEKVSWRIPCCSDPKASRLDTSASIFWTTGRRSGANAT